MKYLIFSDIHSNLEAFEKMLSLKKIQEVDKFLFLGDLVGYGADPNMTIELYKTIKNVHSIRGNHDKVISDLESSSLFNPVAAFSAEWSKLHISKENMKILLDLKKGPQVVDRFITICHGSTFDEDYYVFSIGFFGHTHFPIIYLLRNEKIDVVPLNKNTKIKLDPNTRYLLNPGSIGQPRDKDPNPSFIIFDSTKREIQFIRYSYNIKKAQKKIREAGLPEILASRLESGI